MCWQWPSCKTSHLQVLHKAAVACPRRAVRAKPSRISTASRLRCRWQVLGCWDWQCLRGFQLLSLIGVWRGGGWAGREGGGVWVLENVCICRNLIGEIGHNQIGGNTIPCAHVLAHGTALGRRPCSNPAWSCRDDCLHSCRLPQGMLNVSPFGSCFIQVCLLLRFSLSVAKGHLQDLPPLFFT